MLIFLFFCFSLMNPCIVNAQSAPATSVGNTQTTPGALNADSFADVAALGQEIALAQRKIQAMTLKNNLDALQAQQEAGHFSLKVIKVEGFNNSLYAILTDDTGAMYQVGPGDIINKQYRVSLLRAYSVGVTDVETQKFYIVPFSIGVSAAPRITTADSGVATNVMKTMSTSSTQ